MTRGNSDIKVTVIVTTYNRPSSLLLSGLSLARQERLPDQIVVADDGSGSETARVVDQLRQEVPCPVCHAWQDDLGWRLSASRNNAVRMSTGDYLIFIDGDVITDRGFVAAHVQHSRRGTFLIGNAFPLDEATSGRMTEDDVRSGAFGDALRPLAEGHLARIHRRNQWHTALRRVHLCKRHKPKLVGLNFSLYRSDLELVNGFDEEFMGWGQEDDDFGMRLMSAGVRPKSIVPSAVAYHLYHMSGQSRSWHASRNSQRLLRPHIPVFCDQGLIHLGEVKMRETERGDAEPTPGGPAAGCPLDTRNA
jgi:GT2 family glycosyltransferase